MARASGRVMVYGSSGFLIERKSRSWPTYGPKRPILAITSIPVSGWAPRTFGNERYVKAIGRVTVSSGMVLGILARRPFLDSAESCRVASPFTRPVVVSDSPEVGPPAEPCGTTSSSSSPPC